MCYGLEEGADALIAEMAGDRVVAELRYGAMYALGMAYAGTANNAALKQLLHVAVSDVSDDVRRAAVANIGFLLCRQPAEVPTMVGQLTESYNAHVRYGAAMALGGVASNFAAGLNSFAMYARFLQATAAEGYVPVAALARDDTTRFGTPVYAIALLTATTLGLANLDFDALLGVDTLFNAMSVVLVSASFVRLRVADPALADQGRARGAHHIALGAAHIHAQGLKRQRAADALQHLQRGRYWHRQQHDIGTAHRAGSAVTGFVDDAQLHRPAARGSRAAAARDVPHQTRAPQGQRHAAPHQPAADDGQPLDHHQWVSTG
jgi:hypothetical protein